MAPIARYSTRKQNLIILQYTMLKMWEPACQPQPSIEEASAIIKQLFAWSAADRAISLAGKTHSSAAADQIEAEAEARKEIIRLIQKWFPDWDGSSLKRRFFGKKTNTGKHEEQQDQDTGKKEPTETEHESQKQHDNAGNQETLILETSGQDETTKGKESEAQTEETEEAEQETEKEETKTEEKKTTSGKTDPTITWLIKKIGAGHKVFWLTGPSGSGKTTLCYKAAEALQMPCTIVSCSAGTSPAEFRGYQFPEPRPSAFTTAYGLPGVIIVDEITTLDPSVAAVLNAGLANLEINTTTGTVKRDPECIIIATSNTMGTGADRQYIGNNQLDAATLDRFKGGRLFVDYNEDYEKTYDPQVVKFVHAARKYVSNNKLRRIVSTRAIITACKDKAAGLPWRETVTDDWTPEEIEGLKGAI